MRTRGLLYVVFAGLGIGLFPGENPFAGREAIASQASPSGPIRGQGVLEPAQCDDIPCRTDQPRNVLSIVPRGRTVKKGDLLAELDAFSLVQESEEQNIRVVKAHAELAAIKASLPANKQAAVEAVAIAEKTLRIASRQLETYRTDEYPAQEVAMESEMAIAEERAVAMKQQLDELEAAYNSQDSKPSFQELLDARLASAQAQVDATLARDRLRLLKQSTFPLKVDELELAIAQRELDLLRARNELARITMQDEADLEVAQLIHQTATERLRWLTDQITACTLYAPRDGVVFSSNDPSVGNSREAGTGPGDVVRPGQVLLRVADLTQWKIEVWLRPPFAQKIVVGQSATILCDAFPDRPFHGRVAKAQATTDIDATATSNEMIVTVRLDDPIQGLRPGMTATVEFTGSNTQSTQGQIR
jgi:HlyD family secretion protein